MHPSATQLQNDLTIQTTLNAGAFIILLLVAAIVTRYIILSGRESNKSQKPSKQLLVQLESDHQWRRIKVGYLVISLIALLLVAATTYQPGELLPSQTITSLELAQARSRFQVVGNLFVALGVVWATYRYGLPRLYRYLKK